MQFPLRLLALTDPRLPLSERRAIGASFDRVRPCCASPGLAQQLREMHLHMRDESNWHWLPQFALSVSTSIADTERTHAVSKGYIAGSHGATCNFDSMASHAVNRVAKQTFQKERLRRVQRARGHELRQSLVAHPADGEVQELPTLTGASAFLLTVSAYFLYTRQCRHTMSA
jgi:hypothetical protein